MTCAHCRDAGEFFAERVARKESLRRYRRRGAPRTTARLLESIRERLDGPGFTVLDIGGGVGALQHALVAAGAERVVNVDASPAYQAAVREEATTRGTLHRFEFHGGDFVEEADRIPPADVVTLDRVLCCYPDMPRFVHASARRARGLYGIAVPREHLVMRVGVRLLNAWFAVRRSTFRVYLHGTGRIVTEIESQGLRRVWRDTSPLWTMLLFERATPFPALPSHAAPADPA